MDFSLTDKHQAIRETMDHLGRTLFAPRAHAHDAAARTPLGNLRAVADAGYAGAALREDIGGLGGGALGTDPLASLLIVEHAARYCLSTAQCLHIHYNTSHRLDMTVSGAQRERMLRPIVERGEFLNNTGSEPGRTGRGIYNLLTTAEPVPGGWVLNGVKNYSTLADIALFNAISATAVDPATGEKGHRFFAVPRGAPGLALEEGSWNPLGMRAAFSPTLTLRDCFVADHDVLGGPGDYAAGRWTAKSHLSFAAQYVGGCEGLFDELAACLPRRGTAGDGCTQLRLGEIRIAIDGARWLLYRAAWLWQRREIDQAELASMVAKHAALQAVSAAVAKGAQIAGSSALSAGSTLSRFLRDLSYQALHENPDKTAAVIGRAHLGLSYDVTSRI